MCFTGSLFSKTWRVYKIFKKTVVNRKPIRDIELLAVVGAILLANVLILAVWQLGWPFYVVKETQETVVSDDLFVITTIYACGSDNQMVFTGILLGLQVPSLSFIFGVWDINQYTIAHTGSVDVVWQFSCL